MKHFPARPALCSVLLLAALIGCSSGSGPAAPPKPAPPVPAPLVTHVYTAGEIDTTAADGTVHPSAALWKDGVLTILGVANLDSQALAVVVAGADVYVGGWQSNGAGSDAVLWKNGAPTLLTDGGVQARVLGLAVSGSDVYAAGSRYNPTTMTSDAVLWKHDVPTVLPETGTGAGANAVTVSGSDVYVAGHVFAPLGPVYAAVWKNGVLSLLDQKYGSEATSITVVGPDIYVAGIADVGPASAPDVPAYWKNDTLVQLSTERALPDSITVSGTDVYVGGYLEPAPVNGTTRQVAARVWKNGTEIDYSGGELASTITSTAVSGGSFYAGGSTFTLGAVVRKDGAAMQVDPAHPKSAVFAMQVVQQ